MEIRPFGLVDGGRYARVRLAFVTDDIEYHPNEGAGVSRMEARRLAAHVRVGGPRNDYVDAGTAARAVSDQFPLAYFAGFAKLPY